MELILQCVYSLNLNSKTWTWLQEAEAYNNLEAMMVVEVIDNILIYSLVWEKIWNKVKNLCEKCPAWIEIVILFKEEMFSTLKTLTQSWALTKKKILYHQWRVWAARVLKTFNSQTVVNSTKTLLMIAKITMMIMMMTISFSSLVHLSLWLIQWLFKIAGKMEMVRL